LIIPQNQLKIKSNPQGYVLFSKKMEGGQESSVTLIRVGCCDGKIIRTFGALIGSPTDAYLIPHNIFPAIVPVRYTFLWNEGNQDYTQWAGKVFMGSMWGRAQKSTATPMRVGCWDGIIIQPFEA
jgi:hypothetical protein